MYIYFFFQFQLIFIKIWGQILSNCLFTIYNGLALRKLKKLNRLNRVIVTYTRILHIYTVQC